MRVSVDFRILRKNFLILVFLAEVDLHDDVRVLKNLRRFFEVDANMVVIATLTSLVKQGAVEKSVVAKAIKDLGVDPEKTHPVCI